MEPFVGVAALVGLIGTIYWLGRWILGPIDRAAKTVRAPVRLFVADFLCLFVAVQLPLTFVSRMRSEETEVYFWIFAVLTWVIAPIIWICCAVTLSRAGITNGKSRMVFMGLVLPIAYYGLIPFVVMTAFAIVSLIAGQGTEILQRPWLVTLWASIGAALVACGRFTNRLTQRIALDNFAFNHTGSTMPPAGNKSANGH